MIDFIIRLLDRWFGLREPHKMFLSRVLPPKIGFSYCLGGMALVAFIVSAVSGLLLSIYYVPAAHEAFQSMVRLQNDVWLGGQIRAIHKWSANLLIAFILLHTIRVFIHKAYRPPRELNWMAGAFGFVAVLASGFTGYLLPWDQKAYWATVVGTSMAGTVPVIGGFAEKLLRGGSDVTGATLIRFYSLHVLWLPFSMFVILWAHFHMVKRQGIKGGL